MQDLINGCFELFGGCFILLSVLRLYKDKQVYGVNWLHPAYFTAWGWWNLYYYPSLGQWLSFSGGIVIVILNTIWILQMAYYLKLK